MKKYLNVNNSLLALMLLVIISSCSKDDYYIDGGTSNPAFKGTMLQYLESNKAFDTIASIVKIAGLEKEFSQDDLTFFAPNDYSVKRALSEINAMAFTYGLDSVRKLDDISPAIWRKTLMGYMFKGTNRMKDYPQLDLTLKSVYPGQNYFSYNKTMVNIGVNYNDINGIKYAGYRYIVFSFIPDYNSPNTWTSSFVISHDIKPTNGVVHALELMHSFGYLNFSTDVISTR